MKFKVNAHRSPALTARCPFGEAFINLPTPGNNERFALESAAE